MTSDIPTVDISDAVNGFSGNLEKLAEEFVNNLKSCGFVYVKGHGISNDTIQEVFNCSKQYFQLSKSYKNENLYDNNKTNFCYVPSTVEKFESTKNSKLLDVKESFDFIPSTYGEVNKLLPSVFKNCLENLFHDCCHVVNSLLKLIALHLNMPLSYFLSKHSHMGCIENNWSTLRTLYYPYIEYNNKLLNRCSEHTDYGTLTLLMQDAVGGLEVMSSSGHFVPVIPKDGTIVVNAADLLQRWSNGIIKSSLHRVKFWNNCDSVRQSIAFFCQPDNDAIISCFDESKRYSSVKTIDYLKEKFNNTFS